VSDGICPCCFAQHAWKTCTVCGWSKYQVVVEVDERDEVELSDDQDAGLCRVLDWWHSEPSEYLTLGGYAGTGKTTIIRELIQRLKLHTRAIAVCAFTGKAASVLRSKGIRSARTIHSLIKEPETICSYCRQIVPQLTPTCERTPHCPRAGTQVEFNPAPLLEADLVIVDEASMVSLDLHDSLQAYDVPTLYVGDHGQLEPIGKNPKLMLDPQIRLEKIHRQAEGSAILRFAHHVRQHRDPVTMGPDARVVYTSLTPKNAHEYDMVLVGTNSVRTQVNRMIRRARGYKGDLPESGERIVCLRNDKKKQIYNGMLATVLAVRCDERVDHPEIDIVDDEGVVRNALRFAPEQFGEEDTLSDLSHSKALFDYGYALTVHKSQGSEWKRVLVLERIPHPDTSVARWRYTAATRATEELVWCMREPRKVRA